MCMKVVLVKKYLKVAFEIGPLGMKLYDLLDPDTGESVPFYADYLHKKASEQITNRKQSQNSIDAIASDLKVFLEYVSNAQELFFEQKFETNSTLLADIILSYPEYLVLGAGAQKQIARETALVTGQSPVSRKTANRYLSSVNGFVEGSAITHERLKMAKAHGLIDIDVPSENIHASLLHRRALNYSERRKLAQRSVLSQVIQGGAKYTKTHLFRIAAMPKGGSDSEYKIFPVSHIEALLDAAPSYRDRALWALLLSTGLRMSEATQLLVTDVDIVNETLKVFSYRDRVDCFKGVSVEDANRLSFKGRETENAYFIYPFNEVFLKLSVRTLFMKGRRRSNTITYSSLTQTEVVVGPCLRHPDQIEVTPSKKLKSISDVPQKTKRGSASHYTL